MLDSIVEFDFNKAVMIDTNLLHPESLPRQVALKKVLILGFAKIIVKYAANAPDQQVHAAHFEVPFNQLIEWPDGPPQGTPLCVEPIIEKTRFCLKDDRTIEKLIVLRLDVYPQ